MESSTLEARSTVTIEAHYTSHLHTKSPRRLYEMHDSGHNLRSQNHCFGTIRNDPDPHRVRTVTTTNSENKRTEFPLKLDCIQA